jgi:uncharacterized protein
LCAILLQLPQYDLRGYLAGLRDSGKLALSGGFTDHRGGLNIFVADSAEEVDAWLKADPYTTGGIFVSWEIRPWNIVVSNRELLP